MSLLVALLTVLAVGAGAPVSQASATTQATCGANDAVGERVPLLFVHGFISTAGVWDKAVRRFCSDEVYATAFDYSEVHSNWVTDPAIGPALATRILGLANASRRGGGPGKVLLVGHSMGGLAIRCAADGRCNGGLGAAPGQASPVAEAIAAVTTFATPNLGSFLKADGRSGLADFFGPWFSAVCYGERLRTLGLNPIINAFCDFERDFLTSSASRSFAPGSRQLDELPDQPTGVPVLALAGHASLTVPLFWNGIHVGDSGSDDAGDFVVSAESAQSQQREVSGFGGPRDIDCGGLTIGAGVVGPISVVSVYSDNFKCWHMGEPTGDNWLDQVEDMLTWFQSQQQIDEKTDPPTGQSSPEGPYVAVRNGNEIQYYNPSNGARLTTTPIAVNEQDAQGVPAGRDAHGNPGAFVPAEIETLSVEHIWSLNGALDKIAGMVEYEDGDIVPAFMDLATGKVTTVAEPADHSGFEQVDPIIYPAVAFNPKNDDLWYLRPDDPADASYTEDGQRVTLVGPNGDAQTYRYRGNFDLSASLAFPRGADRPYIESRSGTFEPQDPAVEAMYINNMLTLPWESDWAEGAIRKEEGGGSSAAFIAASPEDGHLELFVWDGSNTPRSIATVESNLYPYGAPDIIRFIDG